MIARRLALSLGGVTLLTSLPTATASEPLITGIRHNWPLTSPPGWYGAGPAGHRQAPVYSDWSYYGLSGGPHINPGIARHGHGFGPAFFGIPGAAGSFWTNGFSLYGPPIPTYGPVPGTFGASDLSRAYFDAPPLPASGAAIFIGPNRTHRLQPPLGWAGQFAPSPRHLPLTVSAYPQGVSLLPTAQVLTPSGEPCCRLVVKVPTNAQVWIQQTEMTQSGQERVFESPPLEAGKEYEYTVIARWHDSTGREQAETRQVPVTPGQTLQVAFGESER